MPSHSRKGTKATVAITQEYIDACKALQEQILERCGGELVPDSSEIIRARGEAICIECGQDIVDVAERAEKRKREVVQMAEEQQNAPRKAKVSRPKRVRPGSWLEEAIKFQEKVLERRGGELLPDSSDWIRDSRETEW